MSSSRPFLRRLAAAMLAVGLVAALMAVPTSAATTAVTGTLSYAESVTLTPSAVAVVTIVDQTAAADAGAIVGEEWIGAPPTIPIDFSVLIDSATLDPTHAYALFATITDGTNVWQNPHGEPVITGGPVSGIDLVLPAVPATAPASITGAIVPPADAAYGPGAVEIASLVKVETGTLVSRQVRPITGPADLAFTHRLRPGADRSDRDLRGQRRHRRRRRRLGEQGGRADHPGRQGRRAGLPVRHTRRHRPAGRDAGAEPVPERIGLPVLVAERRAERHHPSERVRVLVVHARRRPRRRRPLRPRLRLRRPPDADADADADRDTDADAHADTNTDAHADTNTRRPARPRARARPRRPPPHRPARQPRRRSPRSPGR